MPNKWIEFVKKYAKEKGMAYGCAISDPDLKIAYRKENPVKEKKSKSKKMDSSKVEYIKLEEDMPSTEPKNKNVVISKVRRVTVNGTTYLRDKDGTYYDEETREEVEDPNMRPKSMEEARKMFKEGIVEMSKKKSNKETFKKLENFFTKPTATEDEISNMIMLLTPSPSSKFTANEKALALYKVDELEELINDSLKAKTISKKSASAFKSLKGLGAIRKIINKK